MYILKEINHLISCSRSLPVAGNCAWMERRNNGVNGGFDHRLSETGCDAEELEQVLTNQLNIESVFTQYLMILSLALTLCSTTLLAEEIYPECFPTESSWDNIQLETVNLSDNQKPKVKLGERSVTLTFNKFESFLPQFYGFAFLKRDILNIPKITEWSAFEEQFGDIKLVALARKKDISDDEYKSYQFTPPSAGTWVIYLVATVNKIPYLETKQLRISPNVENVRGGSIFSGSSLNLEEPIDYKACVIQL